MSEDALWWSLASAGLSSLLWGAGLASRLRASARGEVARLARAGYAVERAGYQLYRSHGGDYVILDFMSGPGLPGEEVFSSPEEAAGRLAELAAARR